MIIRGISLLVFLACCCSVAAAQESIDTNAVEEYHSESVAFPLPNVIVIGDRKSAPPSIIVRETDEVDFADWNVRTAAGALARTPGVSVQVGGSSGDASPWIRGFRDRDILVLFDGIPIGSALEGTLDLNEISINSVSTTRVMKGAPSVIYGANGLGGVIDVIPRSAERFDSQSVALELAGDGGQSYRGHVGSGLGPLKYFFTAGYEAADEYSLSKEFEPQLNQPTGKRINSDFERVTTTLLLDSDQSPIGDTSIFLNFSDVERGLTPRSTSDDPDFERLTKAQRTTIGVTNHFESLPLSLKVFYNKY
jgi:iron complex outermembrane receptor protein